MLGFQQGKYAVEQVASLSQVLSIQQESLRNARSTLRSLERENAENSLDEEEDARSMIEFWKGMCEETKAALRRQSANVVGMGAAVLAVQPAKARTTIKPGKTVLNVDTTNKSSWSEADSSDSSSIGSMANGKDNLGNKCQKRVRMKEVVFFPVRAAVTNKNSAYGYLSFATIMVGGMINSIRSILYEPIEIGNFRLGLCAFAIPSHCSLQACWCGRRLGRWCVGL